MTRIRLRPPLVPLLVMLASCGSAPAGRYDEATSQAATLASVCSGCHSSGHTGSSHTGNGHTGNGHTGTAIVSLDGYTAGRIASRFRSYRDDPQGSTAMHRMARGYSDEQIRQIAEYLGRP